MKILYTIHKTNNIKSINEFRKNYHTSKDHTRTACRLHDHTRGKNNTNKKWDKNSKNSTGKVEKDVDHDARIA